MKNFKNKSENWDTEHEKLEALEELDCEQMADISGGLWIYGPRSGNGNGAKGWHWNYYGSGYICVP